MARCDRIGLKLGAIMRVSEPVRIQPPVSAPGCSRFTLPLATLATAKGAHLLPDPDMPDKCALIPRSTLHLHTASRSQNQFTSALHQDSMISVDLAFARRD